MTFACEFTFLPRRAPYEITDFEAGQKTVGEINDELMALERSSVFFAMRAKLDPHHLDPLTQKPISWSVEICPVHSFETEWLNDKDADETRLSSWDAFKTYLNWLFKRLKKGYGLVPSVQRKRKDGTIAHMAGAGCHLHVGADLFCMSSTFYRDMERFHRNLAVDFGNRPYIRWLFADWMSDKAHHTLWNPFKNDLEIAANETMEDALFSRLVGGGVHAIESRFMSCSKGSHNTFEFRFFRMVENPEELRLIVRFVEAWVNELRHTVYTDQIIEPSLTKRRWAEFQTVAGSKKHIKDFLDKLGLRWQDYEMFYNRNYRTRMEFGSMT